MKREDELIDLYVNSDSWGEFVMNASLKGKMSKYKFAFRTYMLLYREHDFLYGMMQGIPFLAALLAGGATMMAYTRLGMPGGLTMCLLAAEVAAAGMLVRFVSKLDKLCQKIRTKEIEHECGL